MFFNTLSVLPEVNADGLVSEQTGTASTADKSKRNYFAVHWDNGVYPTPDDGCAGCTLDDASGECKCAINVVESAVFTSVPTAEALLAQLKVGAFDRSDCSGAGDVQQCPAGAITAATVTQRAEPSSQRLAASEAGTEDMLTAAVWFVCGLLNFCC